MADLSAGVLVVEIDGQIVDAEGDFSVQPSNKSREAVVGESGRVYTKTTPQAPTIKGTILVTETVTPEWYLSVNNVSGSVRLNDGRVYSAQGMTSVGTFEHDTIGGKVPVEFYCTAIRCTP